MSKLNLLHFVVIDGLVYDGVAVWISAIDTLQQRLAMRCFDIPCLLAILA